MYNSLLSFQCTMEKQEKKFTCHLCGKQFTTKGNLNRHISSAHETKPKVKCAICNKEFAYKSTLNRHMHMHEDMPLFKCDGCGKAFHRKDNYMVHTKACNARMMELSDETEAVPMEEVTSSDEEKAAQKVSVHGDDSDPCDLQESALGGAVTTKRIGVKGKAKYDLMKALTVHKNHVKDVLMRQLGKKHGIKWHMVVRVRFQRRRDDTVEYTTAFFHGKCHIVLKEEDLEDAIQTSMMKVFNSFVEFQRNGSSWTLSSVQYIELKMAEYRPLRGSSYIPTPRKLRSKMAIVNPRNKDKKCAMWALLAALYPVKNHTERVSNYRPHVHKLNLEGVNFPLKMTDIPKVERQNNVSINVFGFEKDVFPLHMTSTRADRHVNLLLLSDGKKQHYTWIKRLNALLYDQNNHHERKYVCSYCLHGFSKQELLNDHTPYCQIHGPQKIELPSEEDKWLRYKDVGQQLKVPYVLYCDFESFPTKITGCEPSEQSSYTMKKAKHVASGFTSKIISTRDGEEFCHFTYKGPNVPDVFIQHMLQQEAIIKELLSAIEPMDLTDEEEVQFQDSTDCHICHKPLHGDAVRDHDHTNGG